jgi:hypothetical protein
MRALCALTILHPGSEGQAKLTKALDTLYHEYWFEHRKTNEKDVLAEILGRVLGKEDSVRGRWFPIFLFTCWGEECRELIGGVLISWP